MATCLHFNKELFPRMHFFLIANCLCKNTNEQIGERKDFALNDTKSVTTREMSRIPSALYISIYVLCAVGESGGNANVGLCRIHLF